MPIREVQKNNNSSNTKNRNTHFHIRRSKGLKMGLPLSSWPFVKIATVDQWEFWQEKRPIRDWLFVLKKEREKSLAYAENSYFFHYVVSGGGWEEDGFFLYL